MKRYAAILLITICMTSYGLALENQRAGARSVAMADASVTFSDVWSVFHNQAGIASLNSITGAVFYSSKFGLKELSQMAGTFTFPTKTGVFGLGYSQFGTNGFKETKLGLSFAKNLGSRFSAGIQIDYLASLLPENKRAKGFVTFEGGVLYMVSENLRFGAHIFNPVHGGIELLTGKIRMPVVIRAGISYNFSQILLTSFEIEKSSNNNPVLKGGVEFIPVKNLALRFGWYGKPFAYTAGMGYCIKKITTDIGFSYHDNLGFSPSVSVSFDIK